MKYYKSHISNNIDTHYFYADIIDNMFTGFEYDPQSQKCFYYKDFELSFTVSSILEELTISYHNYYNNIPPHFKNYIDSNRWILDINRESYKWFTI